MSQLGCGVRGASEAVLGDGSRGCCFRHLLVLGATSLVHTSTLGLRNDVRKATFANVLCCGCFKPRAPKRFLILLLSPRIDIKTRSVPADLLRPDFLARPYFVSSPFSTTPGPHHVSIL